MDKVAAVTKTQHGLFVTVIKRKRGGQWLIAEGKRPRQYTFKADPALDDELVKAVADLEAYDINTSKAGILRFLVCRSIPNAVEIIREHVEGEDYGNPAS